MDVAEMMKVIRLGIPPSTTAAEAVEWMEELIGDIEIEIEALKESARGNG